MRHLQTKASANKVVPHQPRWLIANDKHDEAAAVLAKLHGEGSPDHPIVQLQLKEMMAQISTEASDKRWWDYRELWNDRSARRRLICVVGMAIMGQASGESCFLATVIPLHDMLLTLHEKATLWPATIS